MIFDIHVHTAVSPCSNIRIDDIVDCAKDKGLDGICTTDHGTMAAEKYIKEGIQPNGLLVILGMEYETKDGDFLIFGPYEDLQHGFEAVPLLQHIHRTGGAAIGAHPFRRNRPLNKTLIKDNHCTIIESVNGRNKTEDNNQLNLWRKKYTFYEVGGSDAHSLKELGSSTTHFTVPITTRSDLISSLQKGLCYPVNI